MTVVERFARNLRRIRTRRDLTQLDFAVRADMHRTEVSLLERALREPRMETLIKLAGALEVPLSELVEGIEWQPFPSPPPPSAAGRFHFSQMERS
jgi:transcriptional regulator with XRE-family HTH domain